MKKTQSAVEVPAGGILPRQNLKAERVQEDLTAAQVKGKDRLKAERVQELLATLIGWRLGADGALERTKVFPTPEVAALYGAFVSRFASAAGFFVALSLVGAKVGLLVFPPKRKGAPGEPTDEVFAFARQLG